MHGVISDKIVSSVFSEYFMLSEGQVPFSFDLLLMKLVIFGWWEIVPFYEKKKKKNDNKETKINLIFFFFFFFSLDISLDFSIRHNIRAVQKH